MRALQMRRQKPATGQRLGLLPPRNHRLKPFVGGGCGSRAERSSAAGQMKRRRGSESFRRGIKKIKSLSTMNMEIDEPRGQIKILGIKILIRGNWIASSNSSDGTRLKTNPSFPELLVFESDAGIVNTRHDLPLVWSGLSCKGRAPARPVRGEK